VCRLPWFFRRAPFPHPQIFARIVGALGGRATEEVVFGDAEVTTGASGDLQQVGPGRLGGQGRKALPGGRWEAGGQGRKALIGGSQPYSAGC
jgi:hypothetical protein